MRNLLQCRRGTAAFATAIALTPLIGVVALGGEAASWYVTKQRAQNAADAAAYSGALYLACTLSSSSCTDTGAGASVAYRGKEFAAQNGFCNSGDTGYPGSACATSLPKGTSQSVAITQTTCNGKPCVQATVQQTQPAYLTVLLGFSTINIGATAKAQVNASAPICAMALTGPISFQGSPNINAPNCGMASNDPANNALNFTGAGTTMNLASISAAGGCTGSTTFCSKASTYQPQVTDPFAALDAVNLPTLSTCSGSSSLTAYSASTPCANKNVSLSGNTVINLPGGVYFISGTLTLKGTTGISGTALFILLPGASFTMKGSGSISVTGNASLTSSQLPAALQPDASLLADMALYDQSSTAIQIGGNSNISFLGNMYAPNATVTFQGNPTMSLNSMNACGQLIAKSIAFNGNATFDDSGCPAKPAVQYVTLVQ